MPLAPPVTMAMRPWSRVMSAPPPPGLGPRDQRTLDPGDGRAARRRRAPSSAQVVRANTIAPDHRLVDLDPEPRPFGRGHPPIDVPDGVPHQLVLHRGWHRLQLEEERVGGGSREV